MPESRKRKQKKRTGGGQRFRNPARPVPPGYVRKQEGRMTGEADSIEDLFLRLGAKVIEMVVRELDEQKARDFRRPFNAFADFPYDDGSRVVLTITGASPGDAEYVEMKPEIYFNATRETVEAILSEKIAAIVVGAVEEMNRQNETLYARGFTLGAFVQLLDSAHLLHIHFDAEPPNILATFARNDPKEG